MLGAVIVLQLALANKTRTYFCIDLVKKQLGRSFSLELHAGPKPNPFVLSRRNVYARPKFLLVTAGAPFNLHD